jgi:hypothetical protein
VERDLLFVDPPSRRGQALVPAVSLIASAAVCG